MTERSRDPSCVFCKIVHGEIPAAKVLESPEAVAFLDINPVNPGHTLLVPKAHHAHLSDLPDALAAATALLLPRLCRAIAAAARAEGLNVIVNNGNVAGQTIDHCHWHIIPRFSGDSVNWPWPRSEYAGDELRQLIHRIERALDPDRHDGQSLD